jgi:two-component system, cell cycle sensor histidine kinase and response regulator CckA
MAKPLRVLIVEDCEDDALLLVRYLQRGGYDPTWVRVDTAAAMRSALDEQTWDIVISDYRMPCFSAFAALNMLKEMRFDLPFIIVSGAIGEETAAGAMKAGAHDYIMKDNVKRLIPAIERELREAEVRRERARAERALRESEGRYRSLVENLHMGVTLIDRDHTIVMTNAARCRTAGFPAAELIGRRCYDALEKNASVCPNCPSVRAMATGEPAETEREILGSDGVVRTARIRAFAVIGADGAVTGCIEVLEDVTERKQMEHQLRQAAQLEAIGRLAGGVAHDFNNLLTAILGYSNMLLQQLPEESLYRDKVLQIGYAAEHAAGLTRQLLAFSRRQERDSKILELNTVVIGFEKILRRLVGEDIELWSSYDPALVPVRADAGQIGQILLNLVVNARDAMPNGGRLTIRTENVARDDPSANLTSATPRPYVMLSVEDTGVGMDEDTQSRVFDPFFTTKAEGKGTGLGLSTVNRIVREHAGYITVKSTPGRGTSFGIYLPGVEEHAETAPEPAVPRPLSRGSETLLVVEDEGIVRRVACEVLELLGYRVLDAANAADALSISRSYKGPLDLLVTDVVMPGMGGERLFRRLSQERQETRVLFVSGYSEQSFVSRGILAPGSNFLAKPFTLESLALKVREVLDRPHAEPGHADRGGLSSCRSKVMGTD